MHIKCVSLKSYIPTLDSRYVESQGEQEKVRNIIIFEKSSFIKMINNLNT